MEPLDAWGRSLAGLTASGVNSSGEQLLQAAKLFHLWLPGDSGRNALGRGLFDSIQKLGPAELDLSGSVGDLGPPFQELAATHFECIQVTTIAYSHPHASQRDAARGSYIAAYTMAAGMLKDFVSSEYIQDFGQAEIDQLGGIIALLHVFSVNARRLAMQADQESREKQGFVDPQKSSMQNVVTQLRAIFSKLMGGERAASGSSGGDDDGGAAVAVVSERGVGAAASILMIVNQLLKAYAFENDWAKGPDPLHDWARGQRVVKRKAEGSAAGNAYQKMGRTDFWFGKPNKNCMPPGWVVQDSSSKIYLQQYENTQTAERSLALPIDRCAWFTRAQVVSYLFLLGKRVLIFDDANFGIPRYEEAHELLKRAFDICHRGAVKNKRTILAYLILTSMLCGFLPSQTLLEKYNLPPFYTALVAAVRDGNIRLFEETLANPQVKDFLLRKGVWMVTACLRIVVQRGFFNHMHRLLNYPQALKLEVVAEVLAELQPDTRASGHAAKTLHDLHDSVELMALRLLHAGYVKGFVRSADGDKPGHRAGEKLLVILKQKNADNSAMRNVHFPVERLRRPPLPLQQNIQ